MVNHTGLVLLRTSLRMDRDLDVWRESFYGHYEDDEEADRQAERELAAIPRGAIVGACMFSCEGVPGDCEYELDDPRRFPEPIPYRKSGPVRFDSITVTARIEGQLRKVGLWRKAKKAAR